jgi:hypothetical protein
MSKWISASDAVAELHRFIETHVICPGKTSRYTEAHGALGRLRDIAEAAQNVIDVRDMDLPDEVDVEERLDQLTDAVRR